MTSTIATPLPVGSIGKVSSGWWGLLCLIATESALFAYLLFSYYYFLVQSAPGWVHDAQPSLRLALPNTLILLVSSGTMWFAQRSMRRGARLVANCALAMTFVLGAIFVVIQGFEWHAKPFSITSGSYGSLYFTITGFHMAHVVVGLAFIALVLVWSLLGYIDARRHVPLLVGVAYWHFVDVVWLFVFFTFYLLPRLW